MASPPSSALCSRHGKPKESLPVSMVPCRPPLLGPSTPSAIPLTRAPSGPIGYRDTPPSLVLAKAHTGGRKY